MTPKEALKTKYTGSDEKGNLLLAYTSEQVDIFKKALNELEELKRYPTSDEVCKELERYVPHKVSYNEERCSFESYSNFGTTFTICQYHENTNVSWNNTIKLRLKTITLIGRFYQGLEESKNATL